MPNQLAITLHASAAETASGTGTAVDIGDRTLLQLTCDWTVLSGTGVNLQVFVEGSLTQSNWTGLRTFGLSSTIGAVQLLVPEAMRYVRCRWVLSGTSPSATFAVIGIAHQLYCLPSDLTKFGIPEQAICDMDDDQRASACLSASDEAAGYLGSAYALPLTQWDTDLRKHVAAMAAADLMAFRGYDPESGPDKLIGMRRDQAIEWLNRIASGRLKPPALLDSTPLVSEQEVYVVGSPSRGWNLY